MRKFGLIDKVKIIKQLGSDFDEGFKLGYVGRILDYIPRPFTYRYQVMRRGGIKGWFNPQELKLIKRKTK
jgi:hypothetical protein